MKNRIWIALFFLAFCVLGFVPEVSGSWNVGCGFDDPSRAGTLAGFPVAVVLFACCRTLTGINADNCNLSVGGIKTAWVACWDDVQVPTVADDKISAIVGSASGTGAVWKEYQFKKNTGQFTSTWTVAENGIKFVATDIVLQFSEMETPKSIEINNLAASGIAMIVKDVNGKYWYFGYDDYLELTAGDAQTGTAKGDFNGYNVTLHDESDLLPYELAQAAIDQLIGTAS